MSFTRVSNLDTSIDKADTRLAEIAGEFGTEVRRPGARPVLPPAGRTARHKPHLVTHDIWVADTADRIIWLRDGRLASRHGPEEVVHGNVL